ncbi:hypothetical protein D3C81_870320 [compost metagenome]
MRVVGVEHQDDLLAFGDRPDLLGDVCIDTRAFDHAHAFAHRVRLDGLAVVRADVDVDAKHFAMALQLQQGGVVED